MEQSEHLPGGSGGVWRIRDAHGVVRIHRPTGEWTPAVHELLRYLTANGLDGVPEVHGYDEDGREVLSYLPGETLDPEVDTASDETLAHASAWLRRFHDTVKGFVPSTNRWRQGEQPLVPEAGQVICHNDPGLYNWVVSGGDFAGMIDWDRAGPGRPIDDLAFLVWSGVPLLRELPLEDTVRRLELAASAYGDVAAKELLEAVSERMGIISERWRVGLANGDPGTVALRDSGIMERHEQRVASFERRAASIRLAL